MAVIFAATACLFPLSVSAFEPMSAKIKVSSGKLYDYVVIGEHAKATDGFDNAFDSISPSGNLNTAYINTYIAHPEWGEIKKNFKGDTRSISAVQEWTVSVASTLPAGTVLSVALKEGRNILPAGMKLTARDIGNTVSVDMATGTLQIPAPGPSATSMIVITARQ